MSFTENLYLKRQLQQLQEENLKLKKIFMQINEGFADAPSMDLTPRKVFRRPIGHTLKPHEDDHFRAMVSHNLAVTNSAEPREDLIARGKELLGRAESAGHTGLVVDGRGSISHLHTVILPGGESERSTVPISRTSRVSSEDGIHTYHHVVEDPYNIG